MTVPARLPIAEAIAFAEDRKAWIAEARARCRPVIAVRAGTRVPVLGRPREIVPGERPRPALTEDSLVVPARAPARSAMAFLKLLARDRLAEACDRHAASAGVGYAAITLRDTRSRWGSCSREGRLMFSWRLAMAPEPVLDYVAAHEVAHRLHMDHSRRFWRSVGTLVPDWKTHRTWLRTEGGSLHAYRFED